MVGRRVQIPDRELRWRFSRSSGPGGQHVNTSDTRVEVSWDVGMTAALTEQERDRVRRRLAPRLVDGVLTVAASDSRSQLRNRDAARERLAALVEHALRPVRGRRPTRPTRGSVSRRLDAKKRRGDTKRLRRPPPE